MYLCVIFYRIYAEVYSSNQRSGSRVEVCLFTTGLISCSFHKDINIVIKFSTVGSLADRGYFLLGKIKLRIRGRKTNHRDTAVKAPGGYETHPSPGIYNPMF